MNEISVPLSRFASLAAALRIVWGQARPVEIADDEGAFLSRICSIIKRIAALLALRTTLDELYQESIADAFTSSDLGIER